MRPVIYNLAGIRAPLTGIGRYAIELIGAMLETNRGVAVANNGKIREDNSIRDLLETYQSYTHSKRAQDWAGLARKGSNFIPYSQQFYRYWQSKKFGYLSQAYVSSGSIFHDIDFSATDRNRADITTIYDLSHEVFPQTHPYQRSRFLKHYIEQLKASDSRIICISNSIRDDLVEFSGIDSSRISVTHLAASSHFRPIEKSQCANLLSQWGLGFGKFVLFVGTIEPRKNLPQVVDAYKSLDPILQKTYPLVIAGKSGWKNAKLQRLIASLVNSGVARQIGFATESDLAGLYAGAAAFVYPSLYEGFGLPLLEAMQSGCPSIISKDPALSEVAAGSALQVDALDSDALAESLTLLLNDSELAKKHSALGLERAKDFSWKKTVDETHKIYNSL